MKSTIAQIIAGLALILITGASVAAVLNIRFPVTQIYFH